MTTTIPLSASGAHLVGSVPLASAEAVFRTIAAEIGDRVRRIPDGETGPRSDWIVWQLPVFTTPRHLEVVPPGPDSWRPLPRVRLADGARPEGVTFGALGYADAALSSYRVFARLKRDGLVPVACRFQVCLPTPLAPISAFVVPEHQRVLEPVYEEQLLHELRLILQEIPHDQLAVQWDTNFEFGMLEGVFPVWFDDVKGGILERLLRLSRHVPPDVQLGYHFCYGDVQHRHFKEPADAVEAGRRGQRAGREPRPPAQLGPPPRPARSLRRGVLRADAGAAPALRDRALPRAGPPHRRRRGNPPAHGHRPALRLRLRRRHRVRLGPAAARHHRRAAAYPRRGQRPDRVGRRAAAAVRVARRLRPRTRPGLDPAAGRHLRPALRHRREPRLVPQPRPDRGGSGSSPEGRGPADRLLGGHRHPARPVESENLRPSGRHADRRQLAQVPARRARQVRRRGARRVPAPALAQGGEAARAPRRGRRTASWWPGRPTPSRPRTRSISTGTCRRPWPPGLGCCGRVGACSCSPGTSETPRPGPASGSWTRPCGRSTRSPPGWSATTRAIRPTARCSTTSRACARTWPTGTRSSCPSARWITISAAWKRPASPSRRSRPAPSRPRSGTGSSS